MALGPGFATMAASCQPSVLQRLVAQKEKAWMAAQPSLTPMIDLCCSCAAARASMRGNASGTTNQLFISASYRGRRLPSLASVQLVNNRSLVCAGSSLNKIPAATASSEQATEGTTKKSEFVSPSVTTEEAQEVLYEIRLSTSLNAGSGLSQPDANILLALIGEDGRSSLFRAASLIQDDSAVKLEANAGDASGSTASEPTSGKILASRFQRGAVDTVTFTGKDVLPLAAMWLAPEAGSWRPMDAVVSVHLPTSGQEGDGIGPLSDGTLTQDGKDTSSSELPGQQGASPHQQFASLYVFRNCSELLLGDGGDVSALQMRPDLAAAALAASRSVVGGGTGREEARAEGLAEYEELKWWLLQTTGLLGALGAALAGSVWGEGAAWSFGAGAVVAVLYLLLLQRAADSIPGPSSAELSAMFEGTEGRGVQSSESSTAGREKEDEKNPEAGEAQVGLAPFPSTLKLPSSLASRVLVLGLFFVAATQAAEKLGWGGSQGGGPPPQTLFVGILGFFTYKITVFLAAFRPSLGRKNSGK